MITHTPLVADKIWLLGNSQHAVCMLWQPLMQNWCCIANGWSTIEKLRVATQSARRGQSIQLYHKQGHRQIFWFESAIPRSRFNYSNTCTLCFPGAWSTESLDRMTRVRNENLGKKVQEAAIIFFVGSEPLFCLIKWRSQKIWGCKHLLVYSHDKINRPCECKCARNGIATIFSLEQFWKVDQRLKKIVFSFDVQVSRETLN